MTTTTRPRPVPRVPYQVPLTQSPTVPLTVPLRDPDATRPPRRPSTPKETRP